MSNVEDDIADFLEDSGLSNIRIFSMDSVSSDQICIVPFGGTGYLTSETTIEKPKIQILVRDPDMKTARDRAELIKGLLHKKDDLANSVFCLWDNRAPDHFEENAMHIFTYEFVVCRAT